VKLRRFSIAVPLVGVCFLALFAVGGCDAGPAESTPSLGTGGATGSLKVGGFEVILRSDPSSANATGTFSLTLNVRNLSGKARSFTLQTGQAYDFVAFSHEGREVWRWSKGMFFTKAVNEMKFEPGDSKVFKVAWNTPVVEPGQYKLEGHFLGLPDVRPRIAIKVTR